MEKSVMKIIKKRSRYVFFISLVFISLAFNTAIFGSSDATLNLFGFTILYARIVAFVNLFTFLIWLVISYREGVINTNKMWIDKLNECSSFTRITKESLKEFEGECEK